MLNHTICLYIFLKQNMFSFLSHERLGWMHTKNEIHFCIFEMRFFFRNFGKF